MIILFSHHHNHAVLGHLKKPMFIPLYKLYQTKPFILSQLHILDNYYSLLSCISGHCSWNKTKQDGGVSY